MIAMIKFGEFGPCGRAEGQAGLLPAHTSDAEQREADNGHYDG